MTLLAAALVLAVHGLAWWGVHLTGGPRRNASTTQAQPMLLVTAAPPDLPLLVARPSAPRHREATATLQRPKSSVEPVSRPISPSVGPLTSTVTEAATPQPDIAAPTPPPLRLLDAPDVRRALRQSAAPLTPAQQAAASHPAPLRTPDQALETDTRRAAKGDCLKGEFKGSGGGLVSLAPLVAAWANGDCAR